MMRMARMIRFQMGITRRKPQALLCASSLYIFEAAGYAAPILSRVGGKAVATPAFQARFCMHRRADFSSYLLYFHNTIRKIGQLLYFH
jgi:hypothetical protein